MAAKQAPTPQRKVGYDCEFVKRPQDAFQTECPVCLHTLRDPYQASCCGTCYCSACYGRLQAGNQPCPTCNDPAFPAFEDKSKRQTLIKLQVYCTHKDHGCKWTGELGDLERHLNQDPNEGAEKNGCDFVRVRCVHCNDQFERRSLDNHPFNQCRKRRIRCTNESKGCNWQGELGELDGHLLMKCSANLVACPNKCGERVHYLDLDSHKEGSCAMAVVDCDFKSVGCRVRLPRKHMPKHLSESSHQHMLLLMEKSHKLEAENATKTAEIEALHNQQQDLAAENAAKVVEIESLQNQHAEKVVEIENLKVDVEREQREKASSTEVQQLRHELGHKISKKWLFILSFVAVVMMALLIGNSGTQLAATRNEFQIQIAGLQNETSHKIADLLKASGELQQEIVDLKTESEGSIANLQNKLTTTGNEFQINLSYIAQGFTLHEFTLTGFSKFQANGGAGSWWSVPFYSHPGGYKIQLKAYTNGLLSIRGEYMSVGFKLLYGDHDDKLEWPITITAYVQLLNQIGDHGHHEKTSTCTFSWRKGERDHGIGGHIHEFIKLAELGLNADKNTQYLRNDRLEFRVYFKAGAKP